MALTGGGQTPPPVRHRRSGRRDTITQRLAALTPLDIVMLGSYVGMLAWGIVAQIEPPMSLVGAAGEALTRIVTLGILVFGATAFVALLFDQGEECGTRGDVELPMLVGLIGAWGTYSVIVWLLIAGLGSPENPVLKVFGVLTTVMLVPFLVRFVTLVHSAVQTLRAARRARELGLVDENGSPAP